MNKLTLLFASICSSAFLFANTEVDNMANLTQMKLTEDYENNLVLKYDVNDYKTYNYSINHISGAVLKKESVESIPGTNEFPLNLKGLQKGTYWIVFESEDELYTEPLEIK